MHKHRLILVAIALIVSGSFRAARATQEPERPALTIRDIMGSQLDPSAQFIWNSFGVEISAAGVIQRAPKTEKDWEELGKRVTALIDTTNQLGAPNRPVARQGDTPRKPEFRSPAEIEKLMSANRTDWTALVRGLFEASQRTQNAVKAKDTEAIITAGAQLSKACESCHIQFWYAQGKR